MSFTLGGRYTAEDKKNTSVQTFDFTPAGVSAFAASPPPFGFGLPLPVGARLVFPIFPNPFLGFNDNTGEVSFDRFAPKLGVEYQMDDVLLFASYSEGFRSG